MTRLLLLLMLTWGCDEPAPAPTSVPPPSGAPSAGPLMPERPQDSLTERVEDARARLTATPAGELVWRAIEAHGGLARWLGRRTASFVFDYRPVGQPERVMHTRNRVDLWGARAVQDELGEGADARFGWDGQTAWITPGPEAFPSPARFWALTPYYFVAMPFVLGDPGVRAEALPDAALDGQTLRVVRITFEPGTGDSPDDYYVLYLHPDTHRLHALRYVVAYPGFFPQGGHSPEKLMRYGDYRDVDGILVAHRLDTFAWDESSQEPGPHAVTEIVVSDVAFGAPLTYSDFQRPPGAQVSQLFEGR